jgi:hypothetical protein
MELWQESGLQVIAGDFTRIVEDLSGLPSPNLLLANPPYVRHHHLDLAEKQRLQALVRQAVGIEVNGLAGLYVYFLLLATAWMQEDGWAAWLIPSEFMDVNYGAALRQYLTDRVTLIRVHRFDPNDIQFGDALVSSVVVVFRKSPPRETHTVEMTFGGTMTTPAVSVTVSVDQLRTARKWTGFGTRDRRKERTEPVEDSLTLGDLFRIKRGIATGSNKFFLMTRAEAEQRELPAQFLRPILPSPRKLREIVIECDPTGNPCIEPQLYLIECDLPEEILKARHPSLWRYLQTAESLGILDGYLVGQREPWYKQEHREPAPYLCTYMGRGADEKRPFRFIWNRSQAIATNLYLMLYPRSPLAEVLLHDECAGAAVFELLGEVTGDELRGEGRAYGGGLHKIEPRELGRVLASKFAERWPTLGNCVRRQKELF